MDFSCGNRSNPLSVSLSQQYLLCLRGESGEAYFHVSNTNKYLLHQRKCSATALLWLQMHMQNSLGEQGRNQGFKHHLVLLAVGIPGGQDISQRDFSISEMGAEERTALPSACDAQLARAWVQLVYHYVVIWGNANKTQHPPYICWIQTAASGGPTEPLTPASPTAQELQHHVLLNLMDRLLISNPLIKFYSRHGQEVFETWSKAASPSLDGSKHCSNPAKLSKSYPRSFFCGFNPRHFLNEPHLTNMELKSLSFFFFLKHEK